MGEQPTKCGEYLLWSSLTAAFLDGYFEQPASSVSTSVLAPTLI